MNTKRQIRPKSRKSLKLRRKRLPKIIKNLMKGVKSKKSTNKKTRKSSIWDDFLKDLGISEEEFNENRHKYPIHPEAYSLKKYEWVGMLTLKFFSGSYSKDEYAGKQRLTFLNAFMENLRGKMKISHREFNWVGVEEFGKSGMGHLHILFSFDYLREKGREDKIPTFDFSEDGEFYQDSLESKNFICRKLSIIANTVDLHWVPQYENEGLVDYCCKVEPNRNEKHFEWSKFWIKQGIFEAA